MTRVRHNSHGLFLCAVALASASGCYAGNATRQPPLGFDASVPDAAPVDLPPSSLTGLPCDIASTISARCTGCHFGGAGAPSSLALTSYADLTMADPSDPSLTVAQQAVARMRDSAAPMPPVPASQVPESEIQAFEAWIASGYPTGACGDGDGGVIDAGINPYDTPEVCSSGTHWTSGNRGSSRMNPGQACISCHSAIGEGPRYSIAGTVFATAHEPNNCNGSSAGATTIVIRGANGAELTLSPNAVGNFYSYASVVRPYTAKVVRDGVERVMSTAQTNGDCNTCHTLEGASSAPGRIMLP